MKILVFDTETSGLNPQWNVILQLSYQIVETDTWASIKTVNHYFAWPEEKSRVSPDAIRVNGLTKEVLEGKQLSNRKAALEEFVADKDACELLVAHNLEFDKNFIIASCREEGVKYASGGWSKSYDTMKRMTSYCQIPKDWGSGYKWPKLTELADCLYINYSNISLHDSSGDVELTKLCFRQIVAKGLYGLPKETDITMLLHVESPDDIRYEIRKNGELIDELSLSLYGISKKAVNAARQELMKQWSEENEEERNDIIRLYHKSPQLRTTEDFKAEIEGIKQKHYTRQAFTEQEPSVEKVKEELEQEAKSKISSWKFWALKKMRQEYVDARLESCYQQQVDEFKQRYEQHEMAEDNAEKEFYQQCEERQQTLNALIEGNNIKILDKEILSVPDIMSLSFPYQVDARLNGTAININLSLPQPKELPQMAGVRLASGNYKIKEIPDKDKKKDYSEWVWGIALYIASYYFNVSPLINNVSVEGHVKIDDSDDLPLYNVTFDRASFATLNLEEMDIDAALSPFSASNKLPKDTLAKLFTGNEKETKQDTSSEPVPSCDSRFSKEPVDLWNLTPPLPDFADEYEIWEAKFYTIYNTLGYDFKGSIFGYVEPKENEDYNVQYASGKYKLTAFSPQGEPIQVLDGIADMYVQWVGLNRCPFVGYVYKKDDNSLPEGVAWIIVPKSREQVLSCASAFYKRRKKKNEIPNIIDLPTYMGNSNSIGGITDSTSFVPLRKRMMEGKTRQGATKKRIEEYRATAPDLTNDMFADAIRNKYKDLFVDNEAVAIEAIKETYRNELPLTMENVMQQLDYLVEDRKLLKYYTELQHIYPPKA